MAREFVALLNWKIAEPVGMSQRCVLVSKGLKDFPLLFPIPPYLYTEIDDEKDSLDKAYAERKNGELAKNALHDQSIIVDNILRKTASYVTDKAIGLKDNINKGGFDSNTGEVVHDTVVPEVGTNVVVEVKAGGYLNLTAPAITGANTYVFVIFRGAAFYLPVTADSITIPKGSPCDVMIVEGKGTTKKLTGFTKSEQLEIQVCGKNTIGYGALGPVVNTPIL